MSVVEHQGEAEIEELELKLEEVLDGKVVTNRKVLECRRDLKEAESELQQLEEERTSIVQRINSIRFDLQED